MFGPQNFPSEYMWKYGMSRVIIWVDDVVAVIICYVKTCCINFRLISLFVIANDQHVNVTFVVVVFHKPVHFYKNVCLPVFGSS